MMILVTGAAGKTGRSVVAALAAGGARVRAWTRGAADLPGAAEIVVGDLADATTWPGAVAGVAAVYLVLPNMHPEEPALARLAFDAARSAGVDHVVYHSVLHPQVEAMPHHWRKLRVEEALLASRLPFTILQPTAYIQNLRAQWPAVVAEGRLALPYPPRTRISLVDLDDVAAAAARVLLEEGHRGATYELVGTPPLTQAEVAAQLGRVANRPVTAVEIPLEQWGAQAQSAGLSGYALSTLTAMFADYAAHGLVGNPNILRWLLGREPRSVAEVAAGWLP